MRDLHAEVLAEFAEHDWVRKRAVDVFGRMAVQRERYAGHGLNGGKGRCSACGRRGHQRRQCSNYEDWNVPPAWLEPAP